MQIVGQPRVGIGECRAEPSQFLRGFVAPRFTQQRPDALDPLRRVVSGIDTRSSLFSSRLGG